MALQDEMAKKIAKKKMKKKSQKKTFSTKKRSK